MSFQSITFNPRYKARAVSDLNMDQEMEAQHLLFPIFVVGL